MSDRDEQKPAEAKDAAWEEVLASLCHLQSVLPEAVLVGGTAAALYAGHRVSFDHDHIVQDLRERLADSSAAARQAEARIDAWRAADAGQTTPPGKSPERGA